MVMKQIGAWALEECSQDVLERLNEVNAAMESIAVNKENAKALGLKVRSTLPKPRTTYSSSSKGEKVESSSASDSSSSSSESGDN